MGAEAVQTLSWDSSPATGWTFSLRGSGTAGLSPATSMEESMWGHWLRGLQGDAAPAVFSWYFSGVSRTQAQQLLLSPPNAPGAFLIRPSESSLGGYSLSGTWGGPSCLCPPPGQCS